MEKLAQSLVEYGLSEKEARVYIALLGIGQANVGVISKKTQLIRTTTYDLLKSLGEKGLVSSSVKNRILYFQAARPEKLNQILEEKKKKVGEIMKELKSLNAPVSKLPASEVYEGKEGIKSIYQDILEDRKPLAAISNTHYVFNVLPFFVPNFVKERIKKNIFIRLLNEKTEESVKLMKKKDKVEKRETRFIPGLKDIPITEYIYGEKVAILSTNPHEPFGLLVRNKDFARAQQILFELLWKKAER